LCENFAFKFAFIIASPAIPATIAFGQLAQSLLDMVFAIGTGRSRVPT